MRIAWVYFTFTQTTPLTPANTQPRTPCQNIQKSLGGTHLHPSPKSVRLWGVRRHRTGWRLVGFPFRSTFQTVQVALFRCMFTVIFVTHKSMIPIPTMTVWTPPWYATTPDLLCVHAVPVLLRIYDYVSKIPPNQVRESMWSWFRFTLLAGGRLFELPNRSWIAPSPFLSSSLP